jgi:hypothetical protein
MNKLVIRGAAISIALVLILLLIFRDRLPFGSGNTSFATGAGSEITRIELSQGDDKLSLSMNGDGWVINDRLEARKSGVLFLLRILREFAIKSPVSDELFKSEITDKNVNPVKVKVYENRKLTRSFLVYKTSSNVYGNIMKMREWSKPFIVYVPSFEGDIGSAFTLNELFWQPYTVFNLLPSEIESVNFENLSDTSSSFLIISGNHHIELLSGSRPLTGWDSTLVIRYLSYFARIPFEKWDLEMSVEEKTRAESQQPLYRITVITTEGKKTILTLWERMKEENGSVANDSDRLLGKTEESNEFFILRYFDIDPLLKKRAYFYQE